MATRKTDRLPEFTQDVERRAARVVTQALVLGASEASVMTPIDTSTLLNSQFKRIHKQGRKVVGRVGYTALYALPVHDPAHPQQFRRQTAKKEFLRKGFEEAAPQIRAMFAKEMKK